MDYGEAKKHELGEGSRFEAIEEKARSEGHSEKSAEKIAAAAGIAAHGKKAMARYSAKGRNAAQRAALKE